MAAERRPAVINAMNLQQLQVNKAALLSELSTEAVQLRNTIGTDTPGSLGGVFEGMGKLLSRAFTTLPELVSKGYAVNTEATTADEVLAGDNSSWSQEAQKLAEALALTNARIKEFKDQDTARKEQEDIAKVQGASIADQYNKLVSIYKESESKGTDAKWSAEAMAFLNSLNPTVREQIVAYGKQNDRWTKDFQ